MNPSPPASVPPSPPKKGVGEKRLFGCACFLLGGNVPVGVWKDSLIARVGQDRYRDALLEPHVRDFDITGRSMTGWVAVGPQGVEGDDQLADWIGRATRFVRTLPARGGFATKLEKFRIPMADFERHATISASAIGVS